MFGMFKPKPERTTTPGFAVQVLRTSSSATPAPINGSGFIDTATMPRSAQAWPMQGSQGQVDEPVTPTLVGLSGLLISSHLVKSTDDLAKVPYEACLNDKLDLAPHLAASIAVLAAEPTHKKAVLLIADTASQDVIDAVIERMAHRSITLLDQGSQAWRTSAPVLMAVVGGDFLPENARVHRSRTEDSGQSALWQSFVDIVEWAVAHSANDLDFVVNQSQPVSQIKFKIDGRYLTLPRWNLPTETVVAMLGIAWQSSAGGAGSKFELRQEQQCLIDVTLRSGRRVRLRWASLAIDRGITVTMRIQHLGASQIVTSLEHAGFLPEQIETFRRAITGKGGLITHAGTVGSGKSVTLAILIGMLAKDLKIVSFEDPVEIEMPGVHQKTISRDLDSDDDASFQAGVKTLFRSALDVFLMGEVRDVATGRVVRAVLESGHSALTTTHAASALGIYTKYASPQVGIPLDVLGTPGMLKLNVYQALLAKNCRCALAPDDLAQDLDSHNRAQQAQLLDDIQALYGIDAQTLRMRNPQGCEHCRRSDLSALWGYAGRTVVAEMVEPDEVMCELVLKGEMVRLKRHWRSLSDGDITSCNLTGKTAMEVAMFKAAQGLIDPREVQQHFDSFRSLASKAQAERQLSQRRAAARVTPLAPLLGSHAPGARSATGGTAGVAGAGAASVLSAGPMQPELEAGVGT